MSRVVRALLLLGVAMPVAAAQPVSPGSEPAVIESAAGDQRSVANGVRTFAGRVRSVSDGDTIVVEDAQGYRGKVRLFGIDAPERASGARYGQPYAQRSRKNLSDLVYRKSVRVAWREHDNYGRMIGHVWLEDIDVALRQVCDGYAWVFRRYADQMTARESKAYDECEQTARNQRRGLWRDSKPVPPWEWRHSARSKELEP